MAGVLLRGKNYDIGSQPNSTVKTAALAAGIALVLENTEGFVANDYIVLNQGKETAEIIKITTVTNATTLVIPALKFAHAVGEQVYKTPFNQISFYESENSDGTYTIIAGSTKVMEYSELYTEYLDATGDLDYYFKAVYVNETTAAVSDIALAQYWQISDDNLPITVDQLRIIMQFDQEDISPEDFYEIIKVAMIKVDADVSSSNQNLKMYAALLWGRYMALRALASKAVSKGYVSATVEGRTITKNRTDIDAEATVAKEDYLLFIRNQFTSEVTRTNFLDNAELVDPDTRAEYIGIMTGLQNAIDENYRFSYGLRDRRR